METFSALLAHSPVNSPHKFSYHLDDTIFKGNHIICVENISVENICPYIFVDHAKSQILCAVMWQVEMQLLDHKT